MIVVSVHPPRSATLAVLIALLSIVDDLQASSRYAYQEQELQGLQCAAGLFRADRDECPRTDGESTWFEKLVKGGYVSPGQLKFGCTPDGLHPLDMHGSPIIAQVVPNVSGAEEFVLRCTGPNGVDDGGLLDDWDIRFGPNPGYWYKSHWPALTRDAADYGVVCGLVTLILSTVVLRFIRHRMLALGILCIAIGLLWMTLWPHGTWDFCFYGTTGYLPDPPWINAVGALVGLVFLFGLFDLLAVAVAAASRLSSRLYARFTARPPTACVNCGYDMRGCPTSVCPECGTDQKAAECS